MFFYWDVNNIIISLMYCSFHFLHPEIREWKPSSAFLSPTHHRLCRWEFLIFHCELIFRWACFYIYMQNFGYAFESPSRALQVPRSLPCLMSYFLAIWFFIEPLNQRSFFQGLVFKWKSHFQLLVFSRLQCLSSISISTFKRSCARLQN